jgi:hypothetical protein
MLSIIRELRGWPELQFAWAGNHALIEQSRSMVATQFIEGGGAVPQGDVLVMIDHDISWEPGDVFNIAHQARKLGGIVSGVYPMRGFGKGVPIRANAGVVDISDTSNKVIEATHVPAGFLAINKEVLLKLADNMPRVKPKYNAKQGFIPFFYTMILNDELLSEDWSFCIRVAANGFPIWAVFTPKLRHTGEFEFTLEDGVKEHA